MPRGKALGPNKRVVLNREAADALVLGYADGLQAFAEGVLARSKPLVPDEVPLTKGLPETGQAVTYIDGRKISGQGSAPRGSVERKGVMTAVGYGFPGRFNEVGTVHQPARPFFTPTLAAELQAGGPIITDAIEARLRRAGNAT